MLERNTKALGYIQSILDNESLLSDKGRLYFSTLLACQSERKAAKTLNISRIHLLNLIFSEIKICVQCKKQPSKASRTRCDTCLIKARPKASKEEKSLYNRDYREKNLEKLKIYGATYQKANLVLFRKARAKYDQTPGGRLSSEKRRARRLNFQDPGMPLFDQYLLFDLLKSCENCNSTEDLCLDHHIPLSAGGQLTLSNTNLLCNLCNSRKRSSPPKDFFKSEILLKIEDKFLAYESFKTVKSPKEYHFEDLPNVAHCRNFIAHYHYSQTCPGVVKAFSLEYLGRTIGVATFSKPSRQTITLNDSPALLELSRFFILDGTPKNTESWFLGSCLRLLKSLQKWDAIVTYADSTEGHTGIIYKACNFELLGITRENYHYETACFKRVHKRQVWDRAKSAGVRELAQATSEGLLKVPELPKFKFVYRLK